MAAETRCRVVAGDVGGTKTLLALADVSAGRVDPCAEQAFASGEHATFDDVLDEFLKGQGRPTIDAACFAVAGRVVDGRVRATNLPWSVDAAALSTRLGNARVRIVNDLEATAFGMLHLPDAEVATLQAGVPEQGHATVIAAGTGLGEAYLFWDGRRYLPMASEGGHADFAPRSDQELELLRYLRRALGRHVSTERVVSGPGIGHIFDFLRDTGRFAEPSWLADRLAQSDRNATIARLAHEEKEPLCVATMEQFLSIYGAEAGNMALRGLTYGGVFVGGGIAAKNLDLLRSGAFLGAFNDKGRFTDLMRAIPVRVSLTPRTALLGAGHLAVRELASSTPPT